jgi:hypothetical protein
MTSDLARTTIHTSDAMIAYVEQRQYALGEGPSLTAFLTGVPALIANVARAPRAPWPVLFGEIEQLPIGSLYAFPLRVGVISLGVCSFYRRAARPLTPADVTTVLTTLEATTLDLVAASAREEVEPALDGRTHDALSSTQIHQATGMIMAQLGTDAVTALARLRGRAFAEGRGVHTVAHDVVARTTSLREDAS